MGVRIPVGYAQLTISYSLSGDSRNMLMTLGLNKTEAQDASDLLDELLDEWIAAWVPSQTLAAYTFRGGSLTWADENGDLQTVDDIRSVVGTNSGSPMPSNCAFGWRKITALGGRRNRGRLFMPPFAAQEADVDGNGMILSTTITPLQGRMDSFVGDMTSSGTFEVTPYLLHSQAGVNPTPITAITLNPRIYSTPNRMNN